MSFPRLPRHGGHESCRLSQVAHSAVVGRIRKVNLIPPKFRKEKPANGTHTAAKILAVPATRICFVRGAHKEYVLRVFLSLSGFVDPCGVKALWRLHRDLVLDIF